MEANSADAGIAATRSDPSATALSIITTEHFVFAECEGRDDLRVGWPGGHVPERCVGRSRGSGLIATATRVGPAFYAFSLPLLPTLAMIGLMTFQRVLQSGIEEHGDARRISRLRAFYFERLPQPTDYMPRVPAQEGISARGLSNGRVQGLLTTAGMVAVVTAVLVGRFAGLLCSVLFDHRLAPALSAGAVVAVAALVALTEYQRAAWIRTDSEDFGHAGES